MIDVSEKVRYAIMLNPWAAIVQQFRHAVIDPEAPRAAAAAGGSAMLARPAELLFGVPGLGYW